MKHKFALLTIVGALLALAVPASSSASMYPAGAKFEFGPFNAFGTSLGSCSLKVTAQVPKAPENEAATLILPIATPTVVSCSSGLSIALAGVWKISSSCVGFALFASPTSTPDAVVFRSTTLPGCKLTSTGGAAYYQGLFLNGTTTPKVMQSSFHPHGANNQPFTWANDGGTCAIAGKQEFVTYGPFPVGNPTVQNLTNPSTPIIVSS